MKVIVYTQDNSSFEYSSVLIYPYYNPLADCPYQIRISHGVVFSDGKHDYSIFKPCSAEFRDTVLEELHNEYLEIIEGGEDVCAEKKHFINLRHIVERIKIK